MIKALPDGPVEGLSPDQLRRGADAVLAERRGADGLWVFAYGALMWDGSFKSDRHHPGRVQGLERRYCIWDERNRGAPARRSLTLGLEPGPEGCAGLAMHVAEAGLATEFWRVWEHEMPGGYYQARWVQVDTAAGPLDALTFIADPLHPLFAGRITDYAVTEILATTEGPGGPAQEYLDRTAQALQAAGVPDPYLDRLSAAVARWGSAA